MTKKNKSQSKPPSKEEKKKNTYTAEARITDIFSVIHTFDHMLDITQRSTARLILLPNENEQSAPSLDVEAVYADDENYDHVVKLDAAIKDQYEHLFNFDFSHVKIHTGLNANEIARRLGADAVTIGSDIYFAQGKFSVDSEEGVKLLAHELQHVVQNKRGDRFEYHEDIQKAEYEAEKAENAMHPTLLFDIMPLEAKSPLPGAVSPIPYPNAVITPEGLDSKKPVALEKSSSGSSGDLGDFGKASNGVVYLVTCRDGSSVALSQGEMNALYDKFNQAIDEILIEERMSMTNDEYSKGVIHYQEVLEGKK